MHLFKEQAVRDYAAAAKAIPVIDYGPYFAGEKGALDRLAERRRACQREYRVFLCPEPRCAG